MENTCSYEQIHSALSSVLCKKPSACAEIKGSMEFSKLNGCVQFYQTANGVIVYAVITGLPQDSGFHGFHIHEGSKCSGNHDDPFADVKSHYNPKNVKHPNHAGDMPPVISSNGNAISLFLTDRFCVEEIIGKTVIIHENADDFVSQPSGNSGKKIACGEIKSLSDS